MKDRIPRGASDCKLYMITSHKIHELVTFPTDYVLTVSIVDKMRIENDRHIDDILTGGGYNLYHGLLSSAHIAPKVLLLSPGTQAVGGAVFLSGSTGLGLYKCVQNKIVCSVQAGYIVDFALVTWCRCAQLA